MFIVDSKRSKWSCNCRRSSFSASSIKYKYILRSIDARSSSLLQIEFSQARVTMSLLERQIKDYGAVALGRFLFILVPPLTPRLSLGLHRIKHLPHPLRALIVWHSHALSSPTKMRQRLAQENRTYRSGASCHPTVFLLKTYQDVFVGRPKDGLAPTTPYM